MNVDKIDIARLAMSFSYDVRAGQSVSRIDFNTDDLGYEMGMIYGTDSLDSCFELIFDALLFVGWVEKWNGSFYVATKKWGKV